MTKYIPQHTKPILWLFVATLLLFGCQSAYFSAMEKFGVHKRDLLVDWVEKARDSQEDAKEQFKSALEEFSTLVNFDGGELQQKYDQLSTELDRSESKAAEVRDRIESVESVAKALFKEWETELQQYSNAKMRQVSQQKLMATQQQYTKLITAMRRAEEKIEPVLVIFRDQVLFLKHNLNAQAIASLESELITIESNVASLIKEMEASIREADAFISTMSKE
jgi:Skp family chaperone for outer membrane proteins